MQSQIYSGLSLLSGKYSIFYPIGKKKVNLEPLFRSKNDENRACVIKMKFLFDFLQFLYYFKFLSKCTSNIIFNKSIFL